MTTYGFSAQRHLNGDVWIMEINKDGWITSQIIIPKDKCEQLAMLLWPDLPLLRHTNTVPSTDYTRGSDDPE